MAKTPHDSNLWKFDNLNDEMILNLEQGFSNLVPFNSDNKYNKIRTLMAHKLAKNYDIDLDHAQILVDGALSRKKPGKPGDKYKSYGVYESVPMVNANDGIENAQRLLKSNPGSFGVLYGYGDEDSVGNSFVLKKPILVKDMNEIRKYERALGGNKNSHSMFKMKGIYSTGEETK